MLFLKSINIFSGLYIICHGFWVLEHVIYFDEKNIHRKNKIFVLIFFHMNNFFNILSYYSSVSFHNFKNIFPYCLIEKKFRSYFLVITKKSFALKILKYFWNYGKFFSSKCMTCSKAQKPWQNVCNPEKIFIDFRNNTGNLSHWWGETWRALFRGILRRGFRPVFSLIWKVVPMNQFSIKIWLKGK